MPATYVARLWLPDLPGTLGLVAAAIGRAGGDVTGIDILERGAGMAIDELVIEIGGPDLIDALVAELDAVPGVNIEDLHPVESDRQDQSLVALDVAARIVESPHEGRLALACELVRSMFEADWCSAMGGSLVEVSAGSNPDIAWLRAFLEGTRHLDVSTPIEHTPGDVAWAQLVKQGGFIACGRRQRAFRSRERQHLVSIARIVDSALGPDPISSPLDRA